MHAFLVFSYSFLTLVNNSTKEIYELIVQESAALQDVPILRKVIHFILKIWKETSQYIF